MWSRYVTVVLLALITVLAGSFVAQVSGQPGQEAVGSRRGGGGWRVS